MATTISSMFDKVNFKPEFSDVTSLTPSNGDCCGSGVTPTEFLPEHQSSDEDYGNSDDYFGYEDVYYPSSDGQSEHFGNDGDLSSENDELGGPSDNEEELPRKMILMTRWRTTMRKSKEWPLLQRP